MISGQLFVLILVALVLGAGILRRYLFYSHRRPRENPEYENKIKALEERVRVLERIVTDKGYELHREFEKL